MYQVSKIILFSTNRWPYDVLTFLIHGFGNRFVEKNTFLALFAFKNKAKTKNYPYDFINVQSFFNYNFDLIPELDLQVEFSL